MTASALLAEIADIGRDPVRGGYSRHLFDDADLALRAWFVARAAALGLRVERDGNANLWAWWDAGDPAQGAIATGSHLDSVPGGGAYDGPLGVVCALEAVRMLRAAGFAPARPIVVCVFAEEEGSRFNAPCLGSKLMVGDLGLGALADRTDAGGRRFEEVWAEAGHDPRLIGADAARLGRLAAFVELHVEQGRDLVDRGSSLAVATAIIPHGRWRATFSGAGNHAGTTPMSLRRDPVVALAGAVLAVRDA
ncbi:MAG: M20/M25/M40 family metallo-hydrolase, partial [Microbacterium sp.]